jgi:hypothetical protein
MLAAFFTTVTILFVYWYAALLKAYKAYLTNKQDFKPGKLACLLVANFIVVMFVSFFPAAILEVDNVTLALLPGIILSLVGSYIIYSKYDSNYKLTEKVIEKLNNLFKHTIEPSLLDTIARYKQYRQPIDVQKVLCQKEWVALDELNKVETLIFQPDGTVMVTANGGVILRKWQYVAQNKCFTIMRTDNTGTMLNPVFVDELVLIFQKEGTPECMFLVDKNLLDGKDKYTVDFVLEYLGRYESNTDARPTEVMTAQDTVEQMKREKENKSWLLACEKNTLESYTEFLDQHPNGMYANEAKLKISVLDDELFEKCEGIEDLRTYLKTFPSSNHKHEALQQIMELQSKKKHQLKGKAERIFYVTLILVSCIVILLSILYLLVSPTAFYFYMIILIAMGVLVLFFLFIL